MNWRKKLLMGVVLASLLCPFPPLTAQDPIYNPEAPVDMGGGYGYIEGAGLAKDYYLYTALGSVLLGAYIISVISAQSHHNQHVHTH